MRGFAIKTSMRRRPRPGWTPAIAAFAGWLTVWQSLAPAAAQPAPPTDNPSRAAPAPVKPAQAAVTPPAAAVPAKPAAAPDKAKSAAKPPAQAAKPPDTIAPAADTAASQFCANIADAAADARIAWQLKELAGAEGRLRERIAELEAKRADYEKWLTLRNDFLKKAGDNVVEIYSRMRPDSAAVQIASMADDTAAAVLAKLNPRSSSAILNEMEPARAAFLANTLAGLNRADDGKPTK